MSTQAELFAETLELNKSPKPPTTRYQGSKLKLLSWIWQNTENLDFHTVLDAFGGTGSVSHLFKSHGKAVSYNDNLRFNYLIGSALIENSGVRLTDADVEFILERHSQLDYDSFISKAFKDIYFTDEENEWLDVVVQNINRLRDKYKQALAFFALFQACIIKRPYNLFHRKNLYMRTADVRRRFGNKATWDTTFQSHFRNFVEEINDAIFDSRIECRALCYDALDVPGRFDLVYIDPPYLNGRGVGVDYLDFYHFLEGLTDYAQWPNKVDRTRKHLPLRRPSSAWTDAKKILGAFEEVFNRYAESILVVSYRSDGIPSEEQLVTLLKSVKPQVRSLHFGKYKYVLSTNNSSKEILLIGY